MMARNCTWVTLILAIYIPVSSISAEYVLSDNSEILGVWSVDAEAPKLDGPKRLLQQDWEFKRDGTLKSIAKDFRGNADVKLKYQIENGKIIKEIRPGKNETCTVTEKEGNTMVLHCRNLYFFLTKK